VTASNERMNETQIIDDIKPSCYSQKLAQCR